jgi:hypothetical protein
MGFRCLGAAELGLCPSTQRVLTGEGSPFTMHDEVSLPPVVERAREFWEPWLLQARRADILRPISATKELSDWLQVVATDPRTASNAAVYFESRSRMRNRTGICNSIRRFGAC